MKRNSNARRTANWATMLLCGASLMLAATELQAQEKVRVSGLTWPGYGFWYIAIAKDLAPDLELSYQKIEDPYESFNLVAAGQMDVVSGTPEFTPVGVERGLPIKMVAMANLSNGSDKIVGAPGIATAADLKGKEVAVVEGGLAQIFMAMWLERNNVPFNSVVYRNIIADDAFAAMIGGSVAASEFWEPYGTNTLKALPGSSILAQSDEEYWLQRAVVADGLYMSDAFITERRDVARKTMKSLYDSIKWWSENPAEGNQIIADGMGMSLADVEMVLGKDGSRLDGGLYVYNFMDAAQFCGAAPGNPPFGQTNGQVDEYWKLISEWWVKFALIKEVKPAATGVECDLHRELYEAGYRG